MTNVELHFAFHSQRGVKFIAQLIPAVSVDKNNPCLNFSTMDSVQKTKRGTGTGRGRGGYKKLNDGVKLPRASKVGPGGGGGRKSSKVANLDELDMMHQEAISQIEHCNETTQLPTG